ncbi:hypothetical protein RFI_17680, partial [Reticulomyxa filosa]
TLAKSEYCTCWDPAMAWAPNRLYYFGVQALTDGNDKNDIQPLFLDVLYRGLALEYSGKDSYRDIPLYKSNSQSRHSLTIPQSILPTVSSIRASHLYYTQTYTYIHISDESSYVSVEPNTGVIFKANASMQLVLPIHSLPVDNTYKNTNMSLRNLRDIMVPTYVITFGVSVNDHTADGFAQTLRLVDDTTKASYIIGYICIPISVLWTWFLAYKFGKRHTTKKDT